MRALLDALAVWLAATDKPATMLVDGVPLAPGQLAGALLRAEGAGQQAVPPATAAALARHLEITGAVPDVLTCEEAATAMIYAFAGNTDAARAHVRGLAPAAAAPTIRLPRAR
jgi:hypothetical protein